LDINARDQFGLTALMRAAQVGHVDVVKLLLDKKAGMNTKTGKGMSALDNAVKGRHEEVAVLNQEHGAKRRTLTRFQN
jgi:ankyrin repeat protein